MNNERTGRTLTPSEITFLRWMSGFYPYSRRIGDDEVKRFAHLWQDEGMVIFTPSVQAVGLSEYGKTIVDTLEGRKPPANEADTLRAELATARATQTTMQEALTAKDAEIEQLRGALEQIAHYAPANDQLTDYEMIVAGQQMILAGRLAKRVLGITD